LTEGRPFCHLRRRTHIRRTLALVSTVFVLYHLLIFSLSRNQHCGHQARTTGTHLSGNLQVLQAQQHLRVQPSSQQPLCVSGMTLQPLLMPLLVHWKTRVSMKRKIMLFGVLSVHHLWYTTPPDHELKLISVCPQSRPSTSQVMPSRTPSSECS